MKNRLLALLGFILLTTPLAATAQFFFTVDGFGEITITGYYGVGGAVTIPATIGGLPVTAIGDYAFHGKGLTSVTIPGSVNIIGDHAFAGCYSLANIAIPYSVSIGGYAFSYCTSLTNVTIPYGDIGDGAFSYCTSLTSVTIPEVSSIGDGAFSYCISLTSVTIPSSVTSIGSGAFQHCTSLSAITVDALTFLYSSVDGVLFDDTQTTLIQYPGGKPGSYSIPGSVNIIRDYAFAGCSSLTSITIPNSVTGIGVSAFNSCANLTGVYFQGNAPTVGSDVFLSADNVTVYYLPGTSGWGPTFAGRPAVLWNPLMQTSGPAFGVGPTGFGFNISGTADIPIVVEATTNLANGPWVALKTLNLTNGAFYFSDPNWTNYSARNYRIRSP